MGYMWSTNMLAGVIGVFSGVFYRFGGVTAEVPAAFRADDSGESLRLGIWKRIHHNIFDPVGMATRTAAVFVPTAGIWIEFQKLVPDWVGHIAAPQLFPQTTRTL